MSSNNDSNSSYSTPKRSIDKSKPPKLQPMCRIQKVYKRKLAPRVLFPTQHTTCESVLFLRDFEQRVLQDVLCGVISLESVGLVCVACAWWLAGVRLSLLNSVSLHLFADVQLIEENENTVIVVCCIILYL